MFAATAPPLWLKQKLPRLVCPRCAARQAAALSNPPQQSGLSPASSEEQAAPGNGGSCKVAPRQDQSEQTEQTAGKES